ncbi:MAG: hypothetical protein ACI9DC_004406 [Gammaproteobacteria bacterium]
MACGAAALLVVPCKTLLENQRSRPTTKFVLIPVLVVLLGIGYSHTGYYRQQQGVAHTDVLRITDYLRANTAIDKDVILFVGYPATSAFAYYAQRKVRMFDAVTIESFNDPRFLRFEHNVRDAGMRVRAVVHEPNLPGEAAQFLSRRFWVDDD